MAVRVFVDSRTSTKLGAPDLIRSLVVSSMLVSISTKRTSAGSMISLTWIWRQSRPLKRASSALAFAGGFIRSSAKAWLEKEGGRWVRGEGG